MALPNHPSLDIEEYFRLDRESNEANYEYIDGHVRMLAGGTPDHAKIAANVIGVLFGLLADSCSIYTGDVHVSLSPTRYVHPDVSVSCDEWDQNQKEIIKYPCLVVEVLSPSTEAYDRGRKLALYRECPTVHEYILIEPQFISLEIFRREKNNLWTYHAFGPDDIVKLTSVSLQFPLKNIYRNVVLPEDDSFPI